MEEGSPTLAPGPREMAMQYVDVRDRVRFLEGARRDAGSRDTAMDLPPWLPVGPDGDAIYRRDVKKANGAGLKALPTSEAVRDAWEWLQSGKNMQPISLVDPEEEAASPTGWTWNSG